MQIVLVDTAVDQGCAGGKQPSRSRSLLLRRDRGFAATRREIGRRGAYDAEFHDENCPRSSTNRPVRTWQPKFSAGGTRQVAEQPSESKAGEQAKTHKVPPASQGPPLEPGPFFNHVPQTSRIVCMSGTQTRHSTSVPTKRQSSRCTAGCGAKTTPAASAFATGSALSATSPSSPGCRDKNHADAAPNAE